MFRPLFVFAVSVVAYAIGLPTLAAPASPEADRVALTSGDVLSGRVVLQTEESVTIAHPVLGELVIPRDQVAAMTLAPAPAADSGVVEAAPVDQVAAVNASSSLSLLQPEAAPAPEPVEPPVKWTGKIELGANGAQGNSDTASLYAGVGLARETELSTLTLEANYRYASEDGSSTTNRLFGKERFDRKLALDSRWSWFVQSTQEFDQFKDYDFRLTLSGGLAYQFIDTERTKLKGYAGLGLGREFGGSDNSLQYFGLIGAEFTHKINERVTFNALAEYEPRLDVFPEYRARAKASLDVMLNDEGNLKLSLGVEDQYNSDPGDAKHNDIYYFAAIVYTF